MCNDVDRLSCHISTNLLVYINITLLVYRDHLTTAVVSSRRSSRNVSSAQRLFYGDISKALRRSLTAPAAAESTVDTIVFHSAHGISNIP